MPGAASTTAASGRASGSTASRRKTGELRAGFAPPALRRIQISTAGSFAGDAIAAVAFGVLAYRAAGPGGVALLVAVQMLPAALLMPLIGLVADRVPRERLLPVIDGGRFVLALAAFALEATGQPRLALLPIAAALTTALAASNTVRRSLVPLVVGSPGQLTATGVASSVVQAIVQTLGPMLAAVLLSVASPGAALLAAAACFAVAALADSGLPSTATTAVRPWTSDGPLVTAHGVAAIRANPELRLTTGLFAAKNLGRGALTVLVVVVSLELFQVGDSGVGWLTAAVGAGGIVGGIVAASLVGRRRLLPPMLLGILLWGAAFLVIGIEPYLAVAIAALAVLGIGNSVTDVAGYTLVGRSARDDVLARVYGIHEAIRALAITAGAGATALVASVAGARAALFAAGGVLAVVALVGLLRRRAEPAEPSAEYLELLRANPIFAWLAPVGLERLASALVPLELAEGAVLLRQGEAGDRAYLLAEGELVARLDGREIGRIHAGEVAGEIALLRDAPRNATVTASTRCRLLAIDPDEFLAAATGSPAARAASDELVERRIAAARR